MKRIIGRMGAWILSLLVIIACIPAYAAAAASLEAGSYSADYVVLRAEDDSASIANDYWEKPATVTIAGSAKTVRMTINHSKWVKEFSVPSGSGSYSAVKVVGTDEAADKRTVEFRADDLSKPISAKIHVTVEDIGYDHKYTIRFSFDANSFKLIKAAEKPAEKPTETPKEIPKETQAADKGTSTGTAKPSGSKEQSLSPASTVKPASTEEKGASGAVATGSGDGKGSPEAVGASAAQEPSAAPAADVISPEASESPSTPADSAGAEEPGAAEASEPGSDDATAAGIADDADAVTASAPLAEEALQPAGDNGRNLKGIYILAGVIIAGAVMFIVQRRKRSTRP
ncbi:heme uptake protein IsdC [Paenibacillus glycanilyticus]|uniref:heme uptake protein IsdC n=1 Tax=Paenibacillus glycanilyticus TaxID=126569 RepID=UPI000FD6D827|nr:heme uptake protein IsdC [Paenibacillus glycanilyticus]